MHPDGLLLALQHGDSAFPSGGFAFSWGLEELVRDGWVGTADDLSGFLHDLLANRWQGFDRTAVRRAMETAPRRETSRSGNSLAASFEAE